MVNILSTRSLFHCTRTPIHFNGC